MAFLKLRDQVGAERPGGAAPPGGGDRGRAGAVGPRVRGGLGAAAPRLSEQPGRGAAHVPRGSSRPRRQGRGRRLRRAPRAAGPAPPLSCLPGEAWA